MNILITSPRAPVALEWARFAQQGGHNVHFADSLRFPIGIFARQPQGIYHRIPSPRLDFSGYAAAMVQLIQRTDLLIPTCEDIFYLAQLNLPSQQRAKCWLPEKELLFQLHDKYRFFEKMPQTDGILFPETKLRQSYDKIAYDTEHKTVLKPVFSRFGRSVIRGVNAQSIQNITVSPHYPWVQQQFIEGQGVCNYAICEHGKVLAHAVYRPRYLLNQSASTYFEPLYEPRLNHFIAEFAEKNQYHGQVAFDFIDDGKQLWLLECNPRATSGLHLLRNQLAFDVSGSLKKTDNPPANQPLRVGAALPLLFGVAALREGKWQELWQDYRRANDVIANLPHYAQWLSLGEMLYRSIRYRKPLTNASTFDIEYDGP